MEKKKSHVQLIKEALERGESLTGLDIITRFQCLNYKGRIHDLRRRGVPIRTRMERTPTGKEYARYFLETTKSLSA